MKNKIRHSFSIRVTEKENQMIDELKSHPYYINMSEFLREQIKIFYLKVKNGKTESK